MSVAVKGLVKSYRTAAGQVCALAGVDLEAAEGELVVVVGPSGSGKSTLLRCIAGLEQPEAGTVAVKGKDVTHAEPGERDVAMVFQDYALYPHLTVADNIGFGLWARKVERAERARLVGEAAELLGLTRVLKRYPRELSGGERQRVALARAIVRRPAAFLLDEPLSNLDAELRAGTRAEIKALQRELKTTMVYVTHDQVEAMTIGDRLAVLRAGRVEQQGPPLELYDRPGSPFVARFLGSPPMNVFRLGSELVGVRPEKLRLVAPGAGRLDATVAFHEALGPETLVHLRAGDQELVARTGNAAAPSPGREVGVDFADADLRRFEAGARPVGSSGAERGP